ncbi:ribosomal-protein-alanine N-acetyltransferase RimI, partial [candidate division KSB3 bacterium]
FLCSELVSYGCQQLFLEVRAKNSGAIKFYLANGFMQVGQRVLYYREPDDDALVMTRPLGG